LVMTMSVVTSVSTVGWKKLPPLSGGALAAGDHLCAFLDGIGDVRLGEGQFAHSRVTDQLAADLVQWASHAVVVSSAPPAGRPLRIAVWAY
jgi:hypothetical protein